MIKKILYKTLDLINKNGMYTFSVKKNNKSILKNSSNKNYINLNIGSGGYNIQGFKDLDIPSKKYNLERAQEFISYDIRTDKIPFKENEVDNIYCSHVIEHIEEKVVIKFIEDCSRVLKKNGVLRIATPDARFLWEMMIRGKNYWNKKRYDDWFISRGGKAEDFDEIDYFIREISTSKSRILNKSNSIYYNKVKEKKHSYEEVLDILKDNLYNYKEIGNHISAWDFNKLYKISNLFFTDVIESKFHASISNNMRSDAFDRTSPEMSLYVDFIK